MTAPVLQKPPDVDRVLADLVESLRAAGGSNLLGVALYGGLAKGRFTPGISDINVLVAVREFGHRELLALAPVLTAARRSHRVAAFVATTDDLADTARLFPVKLRDMQVSHRVLFGDVGLAAVQVDERALKLRARQELRNTALRLRQHALEHGAEAVVLWTSLLHSLPKVAVTLEAALRLCGVAVPADRRGVLRAGAELLGIDTNRMDRFARVHRHEPSPPDAEVGPLFTDYCVLLADLEHAVDQRVVA